MIVHCQNQASHCLVTLCPFPLWGVLMRSYNEHMWECEEQMHEHKVSLNKEVASCKKNYLQKVDEGSLDEKKNKRFKDICK